ncbi:hypothetical protein ACFLTZ_01780 [Chloroflexota bacterium]
MDALHAYDILRQHQINEDRVIAERFSLGLLVNSILMLAFFTAEPTSYFNWIRFTLPIFGIIFSLALVGIIWGSSKAMIGWYDALCKLEQKADFDYMKNEKVRPFTDIAGMTVGDRHTWKLGLYIFPFFPLLLLFLWIFLLLS